MLRLNLRLFCGVFASLFALTEAGVKPTECQMWKEVAVSTMNQEFLNVSCAANSLCTGFSCAGKLLFENAVLRGNEPFGFALQFIPCSYPLVLRLRLNSSEIQFMKIIGVHGRNEEQILLVNPDDDGTEESFGRLDLSWNAILKPVRYFVQLEMNFTRIFMSGEFPPIKLVPLRSYPVPNCKYGAPYDSATPGVSPVTIGCKGSECETRFQRPILYREEKHIDFGLILKVSIGAGGLLVALCALVGFVLVRRHSRANQLRTIEVDNDLSAESEDDLESLPPFSRDSPEDKKNLIRV